MFFTCALCVQEDTVRSTKTHVWKFTVRMEDRVIARGWMLLVFALLAIRVSANIIYMCFPSYLVSAPFWGSFLTICELLHLNSRPYHREDAFPFTNLPKEMGFYPLRVYMLCSSRWKLWSWHQWMRQQSLPSWSYLYWPIKWLYLSLPARMGRTKLWDLWVALNIHPFSVLKWYRMFFSYNSKCVIVCPRFAMEGSSPRWFFDQHASPLSLYHHRCSVRSLHSHAHHPHCWNLSHQSHRIPGLFSACIPGVLQLPQHRQRVQ